MKPVIYMRIAYFMALFSLGLILARAANGWNEPSIVVGLGSFAVFFALIAMLAVAFFQPRERRMSYGYTLGDLSIAITGLAWVIATFEGSSWWDYVAIVVWSLMLIVTGYFAWTDTVRVLPTGFRGEKLYNLNARRL